MAALKYRDEHNRIGFLEKPKGSTDYHQVIDFLLDSHIRYAIVTDPLIYDSLITQFWSTASLRSSELGPPAIVATIDGTPYTITESLVRSQLQLHDEGEFTKSGSWDQFGTPLAIALICLCEGKKYNWSRYIFTGMVNNINNSKKFLMFPRFLQMILDIETRNTKPYHAFRLTSKMFANMRLNFHGDHMPLVAAMLPPPQAAIAAGTSGEAAPPNPQTDHGSPSPRPTPTTPAAQLNKPVSKPPRPIPTSPSAQSIPLGDLSLLLPSRSQQAPPEGKKIEIWNLSYQAPQATSLRMCWGKLSSIYTDSFVHGNDVPTGTASDLSADPSNKGKSPMVEEVPPIKERSFRQIEEDRLGAEAARKLYEEEQAELDRVQEEMKKKRQEDVINAAKYYTDADWSDIMGQVHANQGLTVDLLGPDVNEENFAERMVAIIAERRRQFEAQRLQETRNKPMTFAQQQHFMRTFVKNQSSAIYSTRWTLKYVKTFTDDQLKAEFDKIRNAGPQTPVPAATHQSSAGVTTNVHQSPFFDSPLSTHAVTPVTSVDPHVAPTPSFDTPVSRSSGPRTKSQSSAADIKTYSTRRKSLATRKMPSFEVDLNALKNPLYGMVVKHYEVNPLAGTGMILWGDLHVLFESTTGGSVLKFWNEQQRGYTIILSLLSTHEEDAEA
ncbi:hypothetical protein Tco_0410426 [Tanacetum coccineum]